MIWDNSGEFAALFTFERASSASYRNGDGDLATAGVNVARFDHDPAGRPLGLLVEGPPSVVVADRCRVTAQAVANGGGTVLHEMVDAQGRLQRTAIDSDDVHSVVNARLGLCGHHLRVVILRDRTSGDLRWDRAWWRGPVALIATDAGALASGSTLLTGAA